MECKTEPDFMCLLRASFEDRRTRPRYPCPHRPLVEMAIWPRFGSLWAYVYEVSNEGIGLICQQPIDKGIPLLFRLEPNGKITRAYVIHATRVGDEAWQIGCSFAEPLMAEELAAYLPPPILY